MRAWNDALEIIITILPIFGACFSLLSVMDGREDLRWLHATGRNGLRRIVVRNRLQGESVRMAMHLTGVGLGAIYAFDWLAGYGGSNEARMLAIRSALLLMMILTTGNSIRGWRARRHLLAAIEAHDQWDQITERRQHP